MKKKFELKSSKVKGLAFHKTRHNWIGVGLFTGEVQIWDFRNGFLVSEFKANDSCIRTVDFHPMQSLIISGGDDHCIRGYDYSQNRKILELKNHADFIRTVQFHKELPWILSSSDDQTIRIWNWQSKQQIALVTGHGHYIMCAKFHLTKDLIVSGSLDGTVRIWDYSKLKSKFSSSHGTLYMFSNDVEPFIITEAHIKGVNWVDFHPKENILVTCSDDRLIKLWKYTNSNAYEAQVFHGHSNNVSCVEFSPDGKYLLSNSEDCELRLWDMDGSCLDKIKTGEQRQWILSMHEKLPLVAVGCDKSLNIISLFPENIVYGQKSQFLVYYSNQLSTMKLHDLLNSTSKSFNFGFSSNLDHQKDYCKKLVLNNFGKMTKIEGFFQLKNKNKKKNSWKFFSIRLKDLFSYSKNVQTQKAVFVNSSKFVTLSDGHVSLYKIDNFALQNSISLEEDISNIYPALFNHFIYQSGNKLILYNIEQKKSVFTIQTEEMLQIKDLLWNKKRTLFAIYSKTQIWIVNKKGKILTQKNVESKIKSIIWHDDNKLIYNTHEHICYMLRNGESGIIRSIDKIVFLLSITNNKLICFDINEEFEEMDIDMSEIDFKCALMEKQLDKIKEMLKSSNFLGKSIISYLLKKDCNSITLELTQDKETAFFLALHGGELQKAFGIAQELQNKEKFRILAEEATKIGAFGLAELCLKLSEQKDKLLTHYAITGDRKNLRNLQLSDITSKFNKTLLTGDIKQRIKLLAESGQVYLAYACAKIHKIKEFQVALLKAIPSLETSIKLKNNSKLLIPVQPLIQNEKTSKLLMENWPLQEKEEEIGDIQKERLESDVEVYEQNEEKINLKLYKRTLGGMQKSVKTLQEKQEDDDMDIDVPDEAWGDNDSLDLSDEEKQGDNFAEDIKQKSEVAWKHFAVGNIDGGLELLKKQVGLMRKDKLESSINKIDNANTFKEPPLSNPFDKQYINERYQEIMKLSSQAKLQEAMKKIKNLLLMMLLCKIEGEEERKFLEMLKIKLLNYYIAFKGKLKNDKEKDLQRKTEYCVIMGMTVLEPVHSFLILQIVVNNLYKLQCYKYAGVVIRKYLKLADEHPKCVKQSSLKKMKKVLKSCEQKKGNKINLDLKEGELTNQESLQRIDFKKLELKSYDEMEKCPFDGSCYDKKNIICDFCDVCEVGFKGGSIVYLDNQQIQSNNQCQFFINDKKKICKATNQKSEIRFAN